MHARESERKWESGRESFFLILSKNLEDIKIMRICVLFLTLMTWVFFLNVYFVLPTRIRKTSRSNRARLIEDSLISRYFLSSLPSISNHDARPSYIVLIFCKILKVSIAKLVAICCKLKWFGKKSSGRKLLSNVHFCRISRQTHSELIYYAKHGVNRIRGFFIIWIFSRNLCEIRNIFICNEILISIYKKAWEIYLKNCAKEFGILCFFFLITMCLWLISVENCRIMLK